MENCPCGSNKLYSQCCERFIMGGQIPQTPEELMRSRYTAYSQANIDYIANTMKGPASVDFNSAHAKEWAKKIEWNSLKVIRSEQQENKGTVEFIAHYSIQNNPDIIYEISEFHREDNRWFYFDGVTPKVGRNDFCPCGSQKKYKKCCG